MRHRIDGRYLNRSTPHRVAMRRNMAASLFQHGAIRTTEEKAKEVRRFVEKLITQAKKGTLHARRLVLREMGADQVLVDPQGEPTGQTMLQRLFSDVAPRYANRAGGYTRIIHLAERRLGDSGSQVVLQLVEEEASAQGGRSTGRRRRRAQKRRQAAVAAVKRQTGTQTAVVEEKPASEASAEQEPSEEQAGEQQTGGEEQKEE